LGAAEIAAAAELAEAGLRGLVAGLAQGAHDRLGHALLDGQRALAFEAPARCVQCLLQRLLPGGQADHELHLALGLHGAADHAEAGVKAARLQGGPGTTVW
jgi:hypothetical protein